MVENEVAEEMEDDSVVVEVNLRIPLVSVSFIRFIIMNIMGTSQNKFRTKYLIVLLEMQQLKRERNDENLSFPQKIQRPHCNSHQ